MPSLTPLKSSHISLSILPVMVFEPNLAYIILKVLQCFSQATFLKFLSSDFQPLRALMSLGFSPCLTTPFSVPSQSLFPPFPAFSSQISKLGRWFPSQEDVQLGGECTGNGAPMNCFCPWLQISWVLAELFKMSEQATVVHV